jgi:DNA-binding winged helix-turn-helix (wHTH) protein
VRYRFGRFLLSPGQRVLLRDGLPVRIIPRYFDLLVLLVEERHRAVTRQEIFDRAWGDVVVSDGALSQAVRTLRRALDDAAQTSQFIRTVSRHGYQFVAPDVIVESDDGPLAPAAVQPVASGPGLPAGSDPWPALLAVLLGQVPGRDVSEDERYEAAATLHELGTGEALRRLAGQPGYEEAVAILRDARWDVAGAGSVPLLRSAGRVATVADVIALRVRHGRRLAAARWTAAIIGTTIAGTVAGICGGVALGLTPKSHLDGGVVAALAVIGALAGSVGAAGIGGGLAAAEMTARSARLVVLPLAGALGGAAAGALAHAAAHAVLLAVFGQDVRALGGAAEGLVLGAAIGAGYAAATRRLAEGGMAAPRGAARWRAACWPAAAAAVGGALLAWAGGMAVASSLDAIARSFAGSGVGLDRLAGVFGEGQLRPVTRMVVSAFEALMLGLGLTFGLMHRPRARDRGPGDN